MSDTRRKERDTGRDTETGREKRRERGIGKREGRERTARRGARRRGRTNFLGLPPHALRQAPVASNQDGRRQVARGRQWLGGVRNLGLNLALPLQGAGPPVHLDAKERRNEYAARGL